MNHAYDFSEQKVSSNSVKSNAKCLRICSWNIYGLNHGKLHKDMLLYLESFDIISMQETWLTESSDIEIDGFNHYKVIRTGIDPNAPRGSGGISVFIKKSLDFSVNILKSVDDNLLWLKIENKEGVSFALCSVYIPPEGSSALVGKEDLFLKLSDSISYFKQQFNVIVLGDFNARTRCKLDFIDQNNPDDHCVVDDIVGLEYDTFPTVFCKTRCSQDKCLNNYGKNLLDVCIQCDVRIVNGRGFNDTNGAFTYFDKKGCSVVDYILVDSVLATKIINFEVGKFVPESDHRPVYVELNLPNCHKNVNHNGDILYRYKWKNENLPCLRESLKSNVK